MKARSASLLALFTALAFNAPLGAAPTSAAEVVSSAFAFNVGAIREGTNSEIARGATQMTVLRLLGKAQRELSPDVWVYSGYYPDVDASMQHRCDSLLVTFTGGRVSDLKIVNAAAVNIVAAKLKFSAPSVQVAKK